MNKFRMSETIAARLFLLALLVLCIVVSVMCFPPLATAEGVSTPTGNEQTQLPEFSFKFRSANDWSNQAQEQLTISIVDKYQNGWDKVEVRIDDDAWDDVTSDISDDNTYQMNVWKNCTVTVRVTDTQGNRHTGRVAVDFFDFVNPTVTAGIRTSLLHVEAADDRSGISGVKVNDMLFTTLVDGQLDVQLTELLNSYERFTVYAIDNAGNRSDAVVLTNPYYVAPTQQPTEEPAPTNTPKPTKKPSSGGSSSTRKPTATPKVTEAPTPEVTVAAPVVTPYVVGPGQPFVSEANMGVQSMLYSAHTNKQFIEVTSRNGETYYLVIDYDKPIDAENELYETYFLNAVDDRDLLAVLEEDEIPTPTPTIVPTPTPTSVPVVTDPPAEDKSGNHNHPEGFTGNSLSISDVIAIRHNGEMHCLYVDRWGFKPVPDFLTQENPLKTVELSTEDDMNMIDGVRNNGVAASVKQEERKQAPRRPSIREQLRKEKPRQPAPKRPQKKHEQSR